MSNRNLVRRILLSLAIAIGAIPCIYLLVLVTVHLPLAQNLILRNVERRLGRRLAATVTIRSFKTDLLNSITLTGVKAVGVKSPNSTADVKQLIVNFASKPLLQKRLIISTIEIDGGSLHLLRGERGEFSLPLTPPKEAEDTGKIEKKKGWTVAIGRAYAQMVNIIYEDFSLGLFSTFNNIRGTISFPHLDSLRVQAFSNYGYLESSWWIGAVDSFSTTATINPNRIALDQFCLSGKSLTMNVAGIVPLKRDEYFDLETSVTTKIEPFSKAAIRGADLMSGTLSGTISMYGTPSDPRAEAIITSSSLSYKNLTLNSISLHAFYTKADSLVISGRIESGIGSADIRAEAALPGFPFSMAINGYTIRSAIRRANLRLLAQQVRSSMPPIRNTVSMFLFLRSKTPKLTPDYVTIKLFTHMKEPSLRDTIVARISPLDDSWHLWMQPGKGNIIQGRGIIRHLDTLGGKLKGLINPPRSVS